MTAKTVKQYKCPICGRNTLRLGSHMRLAHPEQDKEAAPTKDTSYKPDVVIHNSDAFTKEELLAAARQPASTEIPDPNMNDNDITYQCDTCHAKVNKTMKQCTCGRLLKWGDI